MFKCYYICDLSIKILAYHLSRILTVIYKLNNKIDRHSLLLMYNSLFHSGLTYCAASWRSNYKHTLNNIIILLNKVFQCIYKLPLIYRFYLILILSIKYMIF